MCTKLSIKDLRKMMMMKKIIISNSKACGLMGMTNRARLSSTCMREGQTSKNGEVSKMRIFWGESGWPWLLAWGGWGAQMVEQGWPLAWGWSPMMLGSRGWVCVCVCVCVCVWGASTLASFHESFEELTHKWDTITSLYSQRPLFILKRWILCI